MKPDIRLTDAMTDPGLFGPVFQAPSFWTWKVVAKLIDGIPLTEPREIALALECTGRTKLPDGPVRRIVLLCGRRAGKDRFVSAVAVWRCISTDWRKYLSIGEQASALVIGADKKQSGILRRYCSGLLGAPLLAKQIVRSTDEVVEFESGAALEIVANTPDLVRGRSAICLIGTEVSHWETAETAARNDEEVIGAAEPSLAMCPDGGLLILSSSVHRKRGLAYRLYKEAWGVNDSDTLVWFAPSHVMNPALPADVIDKAMAKDAARAGAEYLSRWREDLDSFIPNEAIEACTDWGVAERPPELGRTYAAFTDASGGTGRDAFTLAIAHRDQDGSVIIDCIRERRPPFVPTQIVADYAVTLKSYGIGKVRGDKFGGGFHENAWSKNGIDFEQCPTNTSENYLAMLPILLSGRIRLLDNVVLRGQLSTLERVVGAGDRERISHPQSTRDDMATAVAGVAVMLDAAVSILWERSALLRSGKPAPFPAMAQLVYATLTPAKDSGSCGIAYFAHIHRQPLFIIDCGADRLTMATFSRVTNKLDELVNSLRPFAKVVFTTTAIAEVMHRQGYQGVQDVSSVIDDPLLHLVAQAAIKERRAIACAPVLENTFSFAFLSGLPNSEDIVQRALLTGVAVTYDSPMRKAAVR